APVKSARALFRLAPIGRIGQPFLPAAHFGRLKKVIAHFMLRYRFSAKFIGRHSYGVPDPLLNIRN
ncbi:MAG: hypothetical protein ACR2FK_03120, partial [Sphingomicrobium sp.]